MLDATASEQLLARPSKRASRILLANRAPAASNQLRPLQFAEVPVEGAERNVPRLARDLEHHAIGESKLGTLAIVQQCGCHDLRILERQIAVVEQHFNCR